MEEAKAIADSLGLNVGRTSTTEGVYKKTREHLKALGPSPSYKPAEEPLAREVEAKKVVFSPSAEEEEFKTPTAQRTRIEGSGVKQRQQRQGRASPLDLLERIHGEILAGNRPLAAETVRLGTNAIRTLVRRGELSADDGQMMVTELRVAAI